LKHELNETVDAFGIPFIGFPVQKRKRSRTGSWENKPVWIETEAKKSKFQIRVPNVRSWAVSITKPLSQVVQVSKLPITLANPVAEVTVRPVVGGNPEAVLTLDEFRREWPLLRTSFLLAEELYEVTNPGSAADLGIGPTFDELLEVTCEYIHTRVTYPASGDRRDIGIYNWSLQARDLLENAIRSASGSGTEAVPILATPEWLDSRFIKRFLGGKTSRGIVSSAPATPPLWLPSEPYRALSLISYRF
jgi:hypothetical protein